LEEGEQEGRQAPEDSRLIEAHVKTEKREGANGK